MVHSVAFVPEDSSQGTIRGVLSLLELVARHLKYPAEFSLVPNHRYFVAASWMNDVKRVQCAKEISAQIAIHNAIIIVNYDADRKFSPHKSNDDIGLKKKEKCYDEIKQLVQQDLVEAFGFSDNQASEAVQFIVPLVPYWNIESWAYFNKEKLKDLIEFYGITDETILSILNEGDSQFDEKKMSDKGAELSDGEFIGKDVFNELLFSDKYPLERQLSIKKSFSDFVACFQNVLERHRPWK